MTSTFIDPATRSAHRPDPTASTATRRDDDATAGHPATADPVALTPPVDKSKYKWCRGCQSPQPPEGWVGFRCSACATKAKSSPNRWIFNERGDLISKGTKPEPKKPLYDNAGNLIKRNAK